MNKLTGGAKHKKKSSNNKVTKNKSLFSKFICACKSVDKLTWVIYALLAILFGLVLYLFIKSFKDEGFTSKMNKNKSKSKGRQTEDFENLFEGEDKMELETKINPAMNDHFDQDKEVLIVYSYMDGCPHCVKFTENIWSKVENMNGKERPDGKLLKLMKVDTDHVLSDDVRSYPTIRKVVGNMATEFVGDRTVDEFKKFMMA